MKKPLHDVIFTSDKRKNILLLLQNGPRKMENLLGSLETTRQALLPQIRILKDHHLIISKNDIYQLTIIGKTTVDEMVPLLETIKAFDSNIDYWGNHKLDFIPDHLFKRFNEVRDFQTIHPGAADAYELNQDVVKASYRSKSLYILTTFCHPDFPGMFADLIDKGISVHIVMSEKSLESVKCNYSDVCSKLLKSKLFHSYTYAKEMNFQELVYNDYYVLMRLLKNNGNADINYIVSSNPDSRDWARELFECYLKESMPVTEL
ncbi:MAG: winged helix-turn-helix domain-containing protein [Methanolobus sp.]|nr:winged helix-turn-helix domain-containing protein [Methanolobus sp.]